MRPGHDLEPAGALLLGLLLVVSGLAAAAAPADVALGPFDDACPSDDDCGDDDAGCGCCAGVAPALVPVPVSVAVMHPRPAPVVDDRCEPAPSVVCQLLDPPRRLVS